MLMPAEQAKAQIQWLLAKLKRQLEEEEWDKAMEELRRAIDDELAKLEALRSRSVDLQAQIDAAQKFFEENKDEFKAAEEAVGSADVPTVPERANDKKTVG